jgi:mono/diheme cytochrome c family protein
MRWTRWIAFASVLAVACAALAVLSCTSTTTTTTATTPDPAAKIARGRYLFTVGNCGDCHTPGTIFGAPDTTRVLAGSDLGWQGPWGTSYPRNLTPDMETGLGKWSEDDIVSTLRTGKRPDNSPLLPPMPWPNTAMWTDEDLHAVAAYIKSVPAVKHEVPKVVPPGKKVAGSFLVFPAPSAWDAPKGSAPATP